MKAQRATFRIATPTRWQQPAALLLLAILFAQLLGAATRLSATIDEGFHITSGYEYLRTGRMRLFDEHTPLVKALFAWPLFFVPDLPPPEQAAGWDDGDLIGVAQETVLAYQPIDRVVVACRVPVILLTLALAATVCRWAAEWFGPTAGVFALTMLTFDPNMLAHGSLATTDMGAVTFILWAVYAFSRYLRRPSARTWWLAALFLGLAQGAKLTALLLLPVLGCLAIVDAWRNARAARGRALVRRALSYGGMVVVAGLVLWALYRFEARSLPALGAGSLPIPAASHVERWLRLRSNIDYGRESFLLGQNGMHGWWQYFVVAFAIKTPVPTLLLALLAFVALFVDRRRTLSEELALGLFPAVYGAFSLTSTINIGYRHLLPILPFLFMSAGRLVASKTQEPRTVLVRQLTVAALSAWLCVEMLLVAPHYLAYFNLIAGGPDDGYRFLADSNTDWGQGLKALAAYQQEQDLGPVRLSLFTFLDPATYDVRYEPIAPMRDAPPVLPRRFDPEPGLYAISATTLDGVPLPMPEMYSWFQHRQPLAKIGHVMFLYRVEEDEPAEWIAQCTVPVVPLNDGDIREGFGSGDLRQVAFDCTQSWILPDGGASPGWYALATSGTDQLRWPSDDKHLEWWPDWVRQLPTSSLGLSYVQPRPGFLPAFAIWEWQGGSLDPLVSVDPVPLGETLALLGYAAPEAARPGAAVDVLTYWRVLDRPARPLSLLLHLSGPDGRSVAVGDGLGVPVDQWQAGDVIVQRHRLDIPVDALPGAHEVVTGAYWLDDATRLPAGERDHVPLFSVTVGH